MNCWGVYLPEVWFGTAKKVDDSWERFGNLAPERGFFRARELMDTYSRNTQPVHGFFVDHFFI